RGHLPGFDGEINVLQGFLVRSVAEADVVKFNSSAESGRQHRSSLVWYLTLGFQNFLDTLPSDNSLGEGVGHFGELAHGLIHLAQIKQEDEQRAWSQGP